MRALAIVAVVVVVCLGVTRAVWADQWFDSYGRLSINDERARLANLASFLRDQPEMVGYIAFCAGPNDRSSVLMRHKTSSVDFIVSHFDIAKSRFKIINYGRCSETTTILQPIDKMKPAPQFF